MDIPETAKYEFEANHIIKYCDFSGETRPTLFVLCLTLQFQLLSLARLSSLGRGQLLRRVGTPL